MIPKIDSTLYSHSTESKNNEIATTTKGRIVDLNTISIDYVCV